MGEVYLAEDSQLDRKVALKFLPAHLSQNEDSRARFTREAKAAAKLDHPNIVPVYEVGEFQGRPFFAMAHIEGKTVKRVIKEGKLSTIDAVELTMQICEGLHKAHESGVVHRDIKPGNIIIDNENRPRLLDFGLAIVSGEEKLTKTGSTLGTVGYMSPEQIKCTKVDHRSDLFSVGVILYEMLTGKRPFEGDNDAAVVKAITDSTPEPVTRFKSGVTGELQQIVDKALSKDPALRYQASAGMLADLRRLQLIKAPPEKRKPRPWIAAAAIFIVIVLIFVLNPFDIEITSDQKAVAAENRLAVMYFENLADPTDSLRLGEIVTNLLITDLSSSKFLDVVSSQRLYDILKTEGMAEEMQIDRDVATVVATKSGSRWMLLGSVLQIEPKLVITSQLVEVSTGIASVSQRASSEHGEDVFALVDILADEIRTNLPLPLEAKQEVSQPVADVTTNSIEAYRHYIDGLRQRDRFYKESAKRHFRTAIDLDSTFAMAYLWLADANLGSGLANELIAKASKYADKISEKERYYLRYMVAFEAREYERCVDELKALVERYPYEKRALTKISVRYGEELRDFDSAIFYARKAIEVDSLYKMPYNNLAYASAELNDVETSLWAINKYIELAPEDPNPYHTRGQLYAIAGQPDKEIESYQKALEIDSIFYGILWYLGDAYLRNREYAKADSTYRRLATHPEKIHRARGRLCLARIDRHTGQFRRALDRLQTGIEIDSIELGDTDLRPMVQKIAERIKIYYWSLGDTDQTRVEVDRLLNVVTKSNLRNYRVPLAQAHLIFSYASESRFVKADELMQRFRTLIDTSVVSDVHGWYFVSGYLEFLRGEYQSAIAHFERAGEDLSPHYLGLCYLALGQLGDAVKAFEISLTRRVLDEDFHSPEESVQLHFYLGQAYEQSGWHDRAIEQYETFLDIWKNADEGLESVEDARGRLARLKNAS
jgi:serine/threonine protein kinase/tetratricopeptide (TPR) repeat protein